MVVLDKAGVWYEVDVVWIAPPPELRYQRHVFPLPPGEALTNSEPVPQRLAPLPDGWVGIGFTVPLIGYLSEGNVSHPKPPPYGTYTPA